jgi:hypothetical protein
MISEEVEMSIELTTATCAIFGALLSFLLAKKEEKESKLRRLGTVTGTILILVGILAGVEDAHRRIKLAEEAQKLERDWIVIRDSPIEAVEFEILSPHGMISPGVLNLVDKIDFHVRGGSFGPSVPLNASGSVDLPLIFSKENLISQGRLGVNVSEVVTSREGDQKTIDKINSLDCLASKFITTEEFKNAVGPKSSCDAAVTIPVSDGSIRLSSIASWPTISMSLVIPEGTKCLGPCKDIFVSVKVVFYEGFHQEDGLPLMIEISPLLLRTQPSAISDEEHRITASLSGSALIDLAKSYFSNSYGYREQDSFAFTMGAINHLYRWGTQRTSRIVGIPEVVWTTSPSPAEKYLREAIAPERRPAIFPLRSQEWCGFGNDKACWYRFVVFGSPTPQSHR